jgi:hypothetical protein
MASPSSKHRPGFTIGVLVSGLIVGGFLTQLSRRFLLPGAVKDVLTTGVTPSLGPLQIDLVVLKFVIGPIAADFCVLSAVGLLVAYFIARSLF